MKKTFENGCFGVYPNAVNQIHQPYQESVREEQQKRSEKLNSNPLLDLSASPV